MIMKRLKLIIQSFLIIVLVNSCEKVDPVSSCSKTCLNGGTVTANCGCNCPAGYSGENCQNLVYTSVPVNIDPNIYHQLCPAWYFGDDDYGGCLSIEWSVQLVLTNNNTKAYARIYANYKECSSTGNTAAWIDPDLASNQILLYTAPAGKKIHSINSAYYYTRTEYPVYDFHGTLIITNSNVNSFLNKIELIGDTSGSDLPCDGSTERSRYRVYFKSFGVTLVNQ
jgi:hypothetical protein